MTRVVQQAPNVISFILVDGIHRDPSTGKTYLLGTYSTITRRASPVCGSVCAFTQHWWAAAAKPPSSSS